MKNISFIFILIAVILVSSLSALAQTEKELKNYFEGKSVQVLINMPATKDGINVYPERAEAIDYSRYNNSLNRFGVGIFKGNQAIITKIKVKGKHIEFQLGGGGYGTLGQPMYPQVSVPSASKTEREKRLDKRIDKETDKRRKKRLIEERDELRREREREDEYNRAAAAPQEEIERARIQENRLRGGSRFNIRLDRNLTAADKTYQFIMKALTGYVNFPDGI